MNIGKKLLNPILWATIFAIITVAFIVTIAYESMKTTVQVTNNGDTQLIRTHSDTVQELLSELDVTVQPHDQLSHQLSAPVTYGMNLTYIAAKPIELAINGESTQHYTTASTVGEFLSEIDFDLHERDELSHEPTTALKEGMMLEISQAFQVTFLDGGKEKQVWTTASTVEEFLKEHQVSLNPLDEVKPAKNEELSADGTITLTRIKKVTDIVEEELDYEVEKREDSSLAKGTERVISEGEKGLVTKKYEVLLKNGEEVSRELIEETVEKESQKQIVAIGTKVERSAVNSSSSSRSTSTTVSRGSSSGVKTLYMHASAYTANCAGCSGITATGFNLKANPNAKVIAVDPSVIPLGTRVWVEGYGYAIAADTGGAINGNRIDIFFSSKSRALQFGRRTVQVKILD